MIFSVVNENLLDSLITFVKWATRFFIPFEISDSIDTPGDWLKLTRISSSTPSVQYTQRTQCDCHLEDTFTSILSEGNTRERNWSFLYTTKSLPKHYAELEIYLKSLNFKFSFIALPGTWLHQYISKDCMNSQTTHRSISLGKIKTGVGLSLYIADYLKFKHRHDLEQWDGVLVHWHWRGCLILIVTWSLEYYIECPMLVLMLLMKECVTF